MWTGRRGIRGSLAREGEIAATLHVCRDRRSGRWWWGSGCMECVIMERNPCNCNEVCSHGHSTSTLYRLELYREVDALLDSPRASGCYCSCTGVRKRAPPLTCPTTYLPVVPALRRPRTPGRVGPHAVGDHCAQSKRTFHSHVRNVHSSPHHQPANVLAPFLCLSQSLRNMTHFHHTTTHSPPLRSFSKFGQHGLGLPCRRGRCVHDARRFCAGRAAAAAQAQRDITSKIIGWDGRRDAVRHAVDVRHVSAIFSLLWLL